MADSTGSRCETKRDKGAYKRNKRGEYSSHHKQRKAEDLLEVTQMTPVLQMFKSYQNELDRKHDKYERLVKLSRDVTIESKRIIFLIHRINGESDRNEVLLEAEEKLNSIQDKLLAKIAHELQREDVHQYLRSFSPGLQEYIEAVSFYLYVKDERLVSQEEIASQFTFMEREDGKSNVAVHDDLKDSGSSHTENSEQETNSAKIQKKESIAESPERTVCLKLPPLEYMLGLADFTGELMRLCINRIGSGDLETPFQLVTFMRTVNDGFQLLGNLAGREMVRKSSVMKQSLKKMESACYVIKVRGSEIPKHMLKDAVLNPTEFSSRDDDYRQEELAF